MINSFTEYAFSFLKEILVFLVPHIYFIKNIILSTRLKHFQKIFLICEFTQPYLWDSLHLSDSVKDIF